MKIKFGLIGCGSIAQRHALHIKSRGRLVAVCDILPERADHLGKEYQSRIYHKIEDLLHAKPWRLLKGFMGRR